MYYIIYSNTNIIPDNKTLKQTDVEFPKTLFGDTPQYSCNIFLSRGNGNKT